ncbi:MAG: hypothetical protein ABIP53_02285, partial [Candidatus Limnocylindrales bacterium]
DQVISVGFRTGDDKPPRRTSAVNQLLGAEARPSPQVGEVTLHGARTDAHELGRAGTRPSCQAPTGGEPLDRVARLAAIRQ